MSGSDGALPPPGVRIMPVLGLPEFRPGDDLTGAIVAAAPWIADGDVLLITSKVLSKVEGRLVPSSTDPDERDAQRRALIDGESVRLVAQVGRTKIVENSLGIVAAAAGVDASNVRADEIALLPIDPDGSAARIREEFARLGRTVGVIVTDTQGRAWRLGVTDVAIGAAGSPYWPTSAVMSTRSATSWWSPRSPSVTNWRPPATSSRASWTACPSRWPAGSLSIRAVLIRAVSRRWLRGRAA